MVRLNLIQVLSCASVHVTSNHKIPDWNWQKKAPKNRGESARFQQEKFPNKTFQSILPLECDFVPSKSNKFDSRAISSARCVNSCVIYFWNGRFLEKSSQNKKMEAIAKNRKDQESKHFTSLQIFTTHAEPSLDEYLPRKDQQVLEQKQRDEEDKLYR